MNPRTFLTNFTCIVVILGGLKLASDVIMPFLLALFIAVLVSPLINILQRARVPKIVAFLCVTCMFFGVLGVIANVIFEAIKSFSSDFPSLQNEVKTALDGLNAKVAKFHINLDYAATWLDPNSIFTFIGKFIKQTGSLAKTSLFVLLMVAFMLFESVNFKDKIAFLEKQKIASTREIERFTQNLKRYLLIKTLSSIATGMLISGGLAMLNVPYFLLWGIVAFVLNYIPTIGSVVAAIPALFLALTIDMGVFCWVLGLYLVVNIAIGNIIEPRFLGTGLDISPIVVLFSLLLWSYIFGIGGMFLAVPLTMSIQIALGSSSRTKFISVLLGNKVKKID